MITFLNKYFEVLAGTAQSPAVKWISVILLLFSVYLYYPPTILEDHDLWFHLAYGKHFVQNLTWNIDHTVFSWTPTDPQWRYVTWIGSSVFYGLYTVISLPGLYLFEYMLFLIVVWIWLYYIKLTSDSCDIRHLALLMIVAVAINPSVNFLKPELFTVLFFTAVVFLHIRSRLSDRHWFGVYPLLFLLWANTHGGFIMGLLYLVLVFGGEVINRWTNGPYAFSRKKLAVFGGTIAASAAATFVNPEGMLYQMQLYRDFVSPVSMSHLGNISAYQSQWQYLIPKTYNFRSVNSARLFFVMILFILGNIIYSFGRHRRVDASILIASGVFFSLGMQVNRLLIFFPLAWLFFSVDLLRQNDLLRHKKRLAVIAFVLFCLLSFNVFYNTYFHVEEISRWTSDIEEFTPVREIDYMRKAGVPGPFFNDYNIGAYMMWDLYPEQKVFIDSRYWPYARSVIPDYVDISDNPLPETVVWFTSKYPFKAALIQLRELPLILWLLDNPDWRLMYFGKNAAVIVHKSVIGMLKDQAFNVDVSPGRFSHVKNAIVLMRLFDIYLHINVDPRYPTIIHDIYLKNVPTRYKNRNQHIAYMEKNLRGITQRPWTTPAWAVPK